jgi:hypothetical protein
MQASFMRPHPNNAMNRFGLFFVLVASTICRVAYRVVRHPAVNGATDVELSRKRGR